jgi:3-oxoacyl-[acyl-carrier protein] reductase
MSQQSQKVAIITGASRGIGAQVAERLAQDGFAVVINYAKNAGEAEALVARLREHHHTAIAIQADVSQADDVRRVFETAESELGKVDVLVNNAGILKTVPLAATTDALFEQTFAINARGTFNTLREAGRRLNNGGPHHQLLQQHSRPESARIRRLQRHEGRGRGLYPRVCQGVARPEYHRQRGGPWSNRN